MTDLADLLPPWDEPTFDKIIDAMVQGAKPRVFAVVQIAEDHQDARIAAWGLVFGTGAQVVSYSGLAVTTADPDGALRYFTDDDHTAKVVWAA